MRENLVLGSHVGFLLCSICLSFSCIVYKTTTWWPRRPSHTFKRLQSNRKGHQLRFDLARSGNLQFHVRGNCLQDSSGRVKALHTMQYRQVVVDKFDKWLFNVHQSNAVSSVVFKMAENHYMPQTKVDWTSNNASSQFKLWRKDVERIIGGPLVSRSDRVKTSHIYIWAGANAESPIEARLNEDPELRITTPAELLDQLVPCTFYPL